jgi:hypothetical protein
MQRLNELTIVEEVGLEDMSNQPPPPKPLDCVCSSNKDEEEAKELEDSVAIAIVILCPVMSPSGFIITWPDPLRVSLLDPANT